ncbi:hypothetical protein CRG98_034138 [Punica granatum]|uniref:Uncharacterized protein n=1 Tax=Punica granatum TaxID=22663 RepID=A0A2I0IP41_PUNGR|nr:hypothetical protein CRG98_034138 [Punica granatum]
MTWALSSLLNNREAPWKAQQELDAHVGKDRRSPRGSTPGPLPIPHEATEDCYVSGYFVPKGTWLILNLYKIHHGPRVWPDPYEFRSERFLTTHKDIDVRGQHFELIPFGSSRGMCPGISLALQVMGLSLGSLIHAFEIIGDEPVNMEEAIGLTNLKASPLEVLVTLRVPEHV